jgi:hypothetical protein
MNDQLTVQSCKFLPLHYQGLVRDGLETIRSQAQLLLHLR